MSYYRGQDGNRQQRKRDDYEGWRIPWLDAVQLRFDRRSDHERTEHAEGDADRAEAQRVSDDEVQDRCRARAEEGRMRKPRDPVREAIGGIERSDDESRTHDGRAMAVATRDARWRW